MNDATTDREGGVASQAREAVVEVLAEAGVLDALDGALAGALVRLAQVTDPRVALGIALASRAIRRGDVCADLSALAAEAVSDDDGTPIAGLNWPALDAWIPALAASPVTTTLRPYDPANPVAAAPTDDARPSIPRRSSFTPLVLHLPAGRLYLRRYWSHETRLADALLARANAGDLPHDAEALRTALAALFGPPSATVVSTGPSIDPPPDAAGVDAQAVAAWVAARRSLAVVSGGPGTGKTTTVVRILVLLIGQARAIGSPPPRIALLAPTGKAAARLAEAVGTAGAGLAIDDGIRAALPTAAQTIHRALGLRGDGRRSHDADRPLAADIVVVDEASMVDLVLMRRLVDAVAPAARLIVLGDHDQLASVDAGAVLGDICGGDRALAHQAALADAFAAFVTSASSTDDDVANAGGGIRTTAPDETVAAPRAGSPLAASVVLLTHSRRFGAASGIGRLARAIHAGDADAALALLDDPGTPDAARATTPPVGHDGRLSAALRDAVVAGYRPVVQAADPAGQLDALESFRVLCAHRRGPSGVESLNDRIVAALAGVRHGTAEPTVNAARAIIVRQNDYAIGLFNGDIGIVARPPDGGAQRAFFRMPDGQLRDLSPARLPPHETAFALSIHQSQGSEFDAVVVVLPDGGSPLLARELLYTAVTRARQRVTIFGTDDTIRLAIGRRSVRASGLRERLWGT